VAPAPIEALLQADPRVAMAVVAGAGRPAAFAMLMLAPGQPGAGPDADEGADTAVTADDRARATARAACDQALAALLHRVNAGLAPHERLRMLVLLPPDAWTVANGLLTPTLKPRRGLIEQAVSARIGSWFERPGPVVRA
jgi:long-subunit acyl-CoA synthetase (AMP-forming)